MKRMPALTLAALLAGALVLSATAIGAPTTLGSQTLVKAAFNKTLKRMILVDGRGFTLYMYTEDYGGKSTCYNDATYHCSKAWLPLRTTAAPRAGAGVNASLLRVVKRTDGASQVSYNGHPLYTAEGPNTFGLTPDKKPGQIHGQGFASIWYVLSLKGAPIEK